MEYSITGLANSAATSRMMWMLSASRARRWVKVFGNLWLRLLRSCYTVVLGAGYHANLEDVYRDWGDCSRIATSASDMRRTRSSREPHQGSRPVPFERPAGGPRRRDVAAEN